MKKKFSIVLAVLVSIALLWGGYRIFFRTSTMAPDATLVDAMQVKESVLPAEMHAVGSLVARSNVEVTPAIAGHVQKIIFQDGAFIKQGTVLVQLDDAIYKAKYTSAKAKLHYSENNFNRMQLLGKRGAIAKQAIDQAESDLQEKKAEMEESAVMLDKMALKAPFDGTVGKRKVNPGDFVTVGQSVVTLTDTTHLHIEYTIPEKYLPLLKIGQAVKVTAVAYPGQSFTGHVAFISPTINAVNRSVSLYADVPNEEHKLTAGMFVNVTQALGAEERVIMIPARALVPMLDAEQVYKVIDGKASAVTVQVGKRAGGDVQILEGLIAGDQVITDGQQKIKNGMPVKIKMM